MNHKGTLTNYRKVWYHKDERINVLSLSNVKAKYGIMYNSTNRDEFIVHKKDNMCIRVMVMSQGLYQHDTRNRQLCLLRMVENNRMNISQREYKCAIKARGNMVKFN